MPQVTGPEVVVRIPLGLHLRPAGVLAQAARDHESDIRLHHGADHADARSVLAVLALEIPEGATVHLSADGPDAQAAVEDLTGRLVAGLGETLSPEPTRLVGTGAAPGTAIGFVVQVRAPQRDLVELAGSPDDERATLARAIAQADADLAALSEGGGEQAQIFGAHREILRDPGLLDVAHRFVAEGKSAGWAWDAACRDHLDRLTGPTAFDRQADLRDVAGRVLDVVTGVSREQPHEPGSVLVADDLTPSDTARAHDAAAFVTVRGGLTSHVAIIARSLGVPAVVGVDPSVLAVPAGTRMLVDGVSGIVLSEPDDDAVTRVAGEQARVAEHRERDLAVAHEPALTSDGHHVEVAANVGALDEAGRVLEHGGDGIGLLRTELVFEGRASLPSEDEQVRSYVQAAAGLRAGQPLVVRLLDVGGDKPLPALPMPPEANPFLGERGIRLALAHPEVLRTQVRAVLRAAREAQSRVRLLVPMVSSLEELRTVREVVERERLALDVPSVPVGVMVEVPSVALLADRFAAECDFFSIGTNDLTQYALAMDRGHPRLQPDGCHPAVLALVARTVRAARAHGRWVGVCGALASDPQAVPLLVGLGVDELSVDLPSLPAVKAQVRGLSLASCRNLAEQALAAGTAAEVRGLVHG